MLRTYFKCDNDEDHCAIVRNGRLVLLNHNMHDLDPEKDMAMHALGGPLPNVCSRILYWWRNYGLLDQSIWARDIETTARQYHPQYNPDALQILLPPALIEYRKGLSVRPGLDARIARRELMKRLEIFTWPTRIKEYRRLIALDFKPGACSAQLDVLDISKGWSAKKWPAYDFRVVVDHARWITNVWLRGMADIDGFIILNAAWLPNRDQTFTGEAIRYTEDTGLITSNVYIQPLGGKKWTAEWCLSPNWVLVEKFGHNYDNSKLWADN